MNNPTPRPALRKAEDASVHPAAPRPARSTSARRVPASDTVPAEGGAPATAPKAPTKAPVKAAPPATPPTAARESAPAKKAPSTAATAASKRSGRKFQGNTSDHLRVTEPEVPTPRGHKPPTTRPATGKASTTPSTPKPSDPKRAGSQAVAAPAADEAGPGTAGTRGKGKPVHDDAPGLTRAEADALMAGRTTTLEVIVPKKLRKAARSRAQAQGLDLDAVVTELLHRWLTGR